MWGEYKNGFLRNRMEEMDWVQLAQNRIQWLTLVNLKDFCQRGDIF